MPLPSGMRKSRNCWWLGTGWAKSRFIIHLNNQSFVFGSELKVILEMPGVEKSIDYSALSDYFSLLYVPSPRTIFKEDKKTAGSPLCCDFRKGNTHRMLLGSAFLPGETGLSEDRIIQDLQEILDEATRIRMMSEVPLGAFLSGGVDSSAIVAYDGRGKS